MRIQERQSPRTAKRRKQSRKAMLLAVLMMTIGAICLVLLRWGFRFATSMSTSTTVPLTTGGQAKRHVGMRSSASASRSISYSTPFPRVVALDQGQHHRPTAKLGRLVLTNDRDYDPNHQQHYKHYNQQHKLKLPDDPRTKPTCDYVDEWQTAHYPTCNMFHEIDLGRFSNTGTAKNVEETTRLVNAGSFRDVWMTRESFRGTKRALKTLRWTNKRHFDLRNFDRHRRDAVAFEQLTASPHVADIYGHCANSALFDFAHEGDLYGAFEQQDTDQDGNQREAFSRETVLSVAIGVARSIVDAHHFDSRGRPTIAHTDIKPDQWILVDGQYKLNDFNRARFLTWDDTTSSTCGFTVGKNGGIWRSPEEYKYEEETEKVDVWSLGNVLYFILTGKEPYFDMADTDEVIEHVVAGGRPTVSDDLAVARSTHPADVAIQAAMDACFVSDPERRPPARRIVELLEQGLRSN